MVRSKSFIFLVLMPLLIVWSCAETKSLIHKKLPEAKSAQSVKDSSSLTSAQAARRSKSKMDAGEYQEAINIYHVAHQNYPHDQALLKEYTQVFEKIKTIADEGFNNEDFVFASRHYTMLIKNYPSPRDAVIKLSFDMAFIDERLTISKKMISRQGFEEYRKGNLSKAIALWQAFIDIDQNNPEIKRALNTAKQQQKNLEK